MTTIYTSTIKLSLWKEHACVGCGTAYRYLLERTAKGQGGSPEVASRAAQKAAVAVATHEVDPQPCPACGLYQPDMVAAVRRRPHWWLFWGLLPVLAVLGFLALPGVQLLAASTSAVGGALACALAGLLHLLVDLRNPNRDLEANRRLGQGREQEGQLWVVSRGAEEPGGGAALGNGWNAGHFVAYGLLAAAVPLLLAPVGVCQAGGMLRNPDWYPEVVGPGEEATIYFPERISTIGGYWNAQGRATLFSPAIPGLAGPDHAFPVTSNTASWGNSIRVKSSEKNSTKAVWARVRLPDDPRLVGETLELRIDLSVSYPSPGDGNTFSTRTENRSLPTQLRVSAPGSGHAFQTAWWVGYLGGSALSLLGAALLPLAANRSGRRANPTRVVIPSPAGEGSDEPEEGPGEDEPQGRRGVRPPGEDS